LNVIRNIIKKNNIKFFCDTPLLKWRADTLLTKEPETILWINNYASKSSVFYDVGSNIGVYSLYAASINPSLNIFSFEPYRKNYSMLVKNIQLNNYNNLHAFNIAISDKNQLQTFRIGDERVGGSNFFNIKLKKKNLRSQKTISFSLDFLIKKYRFPTPTFLKIDIDKNERKVINGMTNLLKNTSLKSILIELNSFSDIKFTKKFLKKFNFFPDDKYNNYLNHSDNRRRRNQNSSTNLVFKRGLNK